MMTIIINNNNNNNNSYRDKRGDDFEESLSPSPMIG